jgi:Lon protease-like protein
MEKQALVEAPTLKDRAETLITLLEMDVSGQDGGTLQ